MFDGVIDVPVGQVLFSRELCSFDPRPPVAAHGLVVDSV